MEEKKQLNPLQRREDIGELLKKHSFERIVSCCGIEDKYCNTDVWKGNMEELVKTVFRAGAICALKEQEALAKQA